MWFCPPLRFWDFLHNVAANQCVPSLKLLGLICKGESISRDNSVRGQSVWNGTQPGCVRHLLISRQKRLTELLFSKWLVMSVSHSSGQKPLAAFRWWDNEASRCPSGVLSVSYTPSLLPEPCISPDKHFTVESWASASVWGRFRPFCSARLGLFQETDIRLLWFMSYPRQNCLSFRPAHCHETALSSRWRTSLSMFSLLIYWHFSRASPDI